MSIASHYHYQVSWFGFRQWSTMQIVKTLTLLFSLLGKRAQQIDQKVVDTMADTVAMSFFYLAK